jgi:mannose-1-phosphate guanylyltransferase/mannose-6-phosphate isomerase
MDTHIAAAPAALAPGAGIERRYAAQPDAPAALIHPVVLCGGSGTRLWPLSREARPKQFLPLLSERTMLQETLLRATGTLPEGADFAAPMIICNQEHRFEVSGQAHAVGLGAARLVLEPVGRNSAPAVAVAALLAAERDATAMLWVMPADAMIGATATLHAALARAVRAARLGHLVTFGVTPTGPETGFGYIEHGEPIPGAEGTFAVARFIEKPGASAAQILVESGRHTWNSGMFVATAATLLREFRQHAPDVLAHAAAALEAAAREQGCVQLGPAEFAACPSISLDFAVAEHTSRAAVVPATFSWSDVGSWAAIWDAAAKDARGNAARGDAMFEDADRCLIRSESMLAAVVGLQDVMLVVTDDAVLAVHRERAQEVKRLVETLRSQGRSEARTHRRVNRPWGHYESLALDGRCQVKRIVVEVGQRLSLQKHFHRSEHWVVVRGAALVTRDDAEVLVNENECIYLPLGCVHRLTNVGRIPLTLIEVQVGSYLGEDDIVRIEDQYGRAPA